MLFAEISIPILLVFVLQILLLPIQVANSFLRRKDRKHLRMLIMSLTYLTFNTAAVLLDNYSAFVEGAIMNFLMVSVISFTAYFFISQAGVTYKRFKLINKICILSILFLVYNSARVLFVDCDYYFEWMLFIGFEILGIHAVIAFSKIKNEQSNELKLFTPLEVVVFSIFLLLPVALPLITEKSIHCVLINLIFFVLSFQYMKNYFNQLPVNDETVSVDSQLEPAIFKEFEFTERQKEICLLLLEGMDLKQIPGILPISYDTVRSHLNNIYSKTGVKGLSALKNELTRLK